MDCKFNKPYNNKISVSDPPVNNYNSLTMSNPNMSYRKYMSKVRDRRCLNFVYLHRNRELQEYDWRLFGQKAQVSHSLIDRLGLVKELNGHCGCVNCIEFNENGNYLLSGSDDFSIILWDVHRRRKLKFLSTGHRGNIFSVKFLPQTDDSMIVSGAGDCRIEVREVQSGEATQVCTCHSERIKRIATVPLTPSLFFTASEDGTVMQFDTRQKHICSSQPNNVLVNLKQHASRTAECKCVTVHPLRSEIVAVGASDPYVRVYDRRMIKLTSIQYPSGGSSLPCWERRNYAVSQLDASTDNLPPGCVQFYVPGHLPSKMKHYFRRYRSLATTYLSYSTDGAHLLANLGGDHIYVFSMNEAEAHATYSVPPKATHEQIFNAFTGRTKIPVASSYPMESGPHLNLGSKAEMLRKEAVRSFEAKEYTTAIEIYNSIILHYEDISQLYSDRAAALMERKWDGDIYAALRDYNKAVELNPNNIEARLRQLPCLHLLGLDRLDQETQQRLHELEEQYPELNSVPTFNAICQELSRNTSNTQSSERDREEEGAPIPPVSAQEKAWRGLAKDYEKVYNGHCNTTTDIKEAVFVGKRGEFIAAGSDDGNLFIWDRHTTNLVKVLRADTSIVNCVQAHPNICMLATSGIESVVKLWGPQGDKDDGEESVKMNLAAITQENQHRMSTDPVEMMILQMGDFVEGWVEVNGENDPQLPQGQNRMQCRPS